MIPDAKTADVAEIVSERVPTGRDAAVAVVALMQRTVKRLPPMTIVTCSTPADERPGRRDGRS